VQLGVVASVSLFTATMSILFLDGEQSGTMAFGERASPRPNTNEYC
jgi:hypothetical protein